MHPSDHSGADCRHAPGQLTPQQRMKYEIAKELGLLDKVLTDGWQSLSAKETG